MDEIDRRRGLHRVVQVIGASRSGSGFAVGSGLVLTCAHSLQGESRVRVYVPYLREEMQAIVLGHADDIALLRVQDDAWPELQVLSTRFGRPVGDRAVRCLAAGFPSFQERDRARALEVAAGSIMPGTHQGTGLFAFTVAGVPPNPVGVPWTGLSGGAVLAEGSGHLLGIVKARTSSHPNSRLDVVPISRLLADEVLRTWLDSQPEDIEDVHQRDGVEELGNVLRPAFLPRPARWIDQELLVPEYGVVTFIGRTKETEALRDWCRSSVLTSVAVISGDGGSGKSRLAAKLCQEMQTDLYWAAGAAPPELQRSMEITQPTLVVVDYVEEEQQVALVVDLIERFHARRRGSKLRILLLSRRPVWQYWDKLSARLRYHLDDPPSVELANGLTGMPERLAHAQRAAQDFANALNLAVPPPPDVTGSDFANPLLVHFAALLAVHGEQIDESVGGGRRDQVLGTWIKRELRRWRQAQPAHGLDFSDEEILDIVALVTLAGPTPAELPAVLRGSYLFSQADERSMDHACRWLGQLFSVGGPVLTVRPDLLAERVIDDAPHREKMREATRLFRREQADRASRLADASRTPTALVGRTRAEIDAELLAAVGRIARMPQLLIACDYDGTLAPLADDPSQAAPLPEAVAAIRALAALPQTAVAVVSSRALRDLATLSRLPSEVHLVGSHGSEFDPGFVRRLAPELNALRDRLREAVEGIIREHPLVEMETKPVGVAVHTRTAGPEVANQIFEAIRTGPATWPGVHIALGRHVIELLVLATHKGTAIDQLRRQLSASAVLFVGDDVTDENAFKQLYGPDIGIKIGPGVTRASFRVDEPIDAVRVLGLLLETRRSWLFGERATPIERHTMLANGRTVALLTPDAKVTWLCHPNPDSSAVFADLLGGAPAGYFSIRPADGESRIPLGQRYRPGTMTVETRWSGLYVTDWLDVGVPPGDNEEAPESTSLIRTLTGKNKAKVTFAPRPEFGQVRIQLQPLGDGLLVLGSNEPVALYSPGVEWEVFDDNGHDSARAEIDLAAMGGQCVLELRCGSHGLRPWDEPLEVRQARAEREWSDWAASLKLPSVARDQVLRSALTLRGLVHQPSGSIIAAATSSLPETLGGVRNWDYRYCWLRDAAMTARALVDLGSIAEAEAFLEYVGRCTERTGGHPERLHPLYTVDGWDLGPEAVIETLPGYAGSRPVRIGNVANRQLQLGIFGAITDVIAGVAGVRGSVRDEEWQVLEAMVAAVERRWHEPDHGLWNIARIAPRHHVYSKVMCWLTVDRAVNLSREYRGEDRPEWTELRERIGANVLEHGWHEEAGAYSVAYGSPEMDASSLWIGLSGLLADDDPRFLSTVLAIEADLRSGPTVYRYKWDDGLPGVEGGFHVCAAWMIEAYLRTGRRADAEELFDQMLDCAGPTGLLPEQYDPEGERGLGNHPQAYSHLGLIRCAMLLDGTLK